MQRSCEACGGAYEAKRSSSRFCSDRCRKRAKRSGLNEPVPPRGPEHEAASAVLPSVVRQLTEAGALDSPAGQLCVTLATRLDTPGIDTGSAVAAVSRELRAVLADALGTAETAADPIDELRERRDRRNAG